MTPNLFNSLKKAFDSIEVHSNGKRVPVLKAVRAVVKILKTQSRKRGKAILIGNGGSAAIASHQAVDLWKNAGIPAVCFNDASLLTCISNDFSYSEVFEKPLQMFARREDVLLAISSSGKSQNILRAVRAAQAQGLTVITYSGFEPKNPLRALGDINFYVPDHNYGTVEITHLTLIHAVVDSLMDRP